MSTYMRDKENACMQGKQGYRDGKEKWLNNLQEYMSFSVISETVTFLALVASGVLS